VSGKNTAVDSVGTSSTQAERSALSDKRMYEAAVYFINERGTAKTTLKDIGERAGYSRGLASYRFGSKDGLWIELFNKFDELWKGHLGNYVAGKRGLKAIVAALHAQRDIFEQQPDYLRAMYILWYESLGEESDIRAKLARHHQIYQRDLVRWVKQGVEDGEIDAQISAKYFAISYCSTMFGTIYQWVVAADAIEMDPLFSFLEDTILASLKPARH